jgi:hypothetical protein
MERFCVTKESPRLSKTGLVQFTYFVSPLQLRRQSILSTRSGDYGRHETDCPQNIFQVSHQYRKFPCGVLEFLSFPSPVQFLPQSRLLTGNGWLQAAVKKIAQ